MGDAEVKKELESVFGAETEDKWKKVCNNKYRVCSESLVTILFLPLLNVGF
jgi:hypothetical protein